MSIKTIVTLNGFSLVRQIGEGGMGEVWLVQDSKTRIFYAAKFLSRMLARDKDRERFRREIDILKALDYASIIRIYEIIDNGDTLGYVMENCPDGDLKTYYQRNPKANIVSFMEQLVEAVMHLHANKFIHRDIKPSNLLVSQDGALRLSDFGLSVTTEIGRKVVTSSNWYSEGFTAPEQYVDMTSVNYRADIYSIGAVWFYFLTGRTFNFMTDMDAQLKDCNSPNRKILTRALQRNPDDRLPELASFLTVLKALKQDDVREYFDSDPSKRLELLEARYRVCISNPHTVDNVNDNEAISFLHFLELIVEYEGDDALKARIAKLHSELDSAMKWIAAVMQQENP